MQTIIAYIGAAITEIAGCYAFWGWLRLGKPVWWVILGLISLGLFAYFLTLTDSLVAGRAYAAYGGIYVASSLIWLWVMEGMQPDQWDFIGACVCILGAVIIIAGPRSVIRF